MIDYQLAANEIGCEVAVIQAIASVESNGVGYDTAGRIIIRFEGHAFKKLTKGKYDKSNPELSYPYSQWRKRRHGRNEFNAAFALDPIAAMQATSWGLFQIMGFNFKFCGFKTVNEFVDFVSKSETNQVIAMIRLMESKGLARAMKNKDWATIARKWNGSDNAINSYPLKLAAAYDKFSMAA
jgi:hypothetical protein